MKQFIHSILAFFIVISCTIKTSDAQINTALDAMKAAKTQLILSQSAVKDYFLIGINCEDSPVNEARTSLMNSIELFEQYRDSLCLWFSQNSVSYNINDLYIYWESCKDFFSMNPDKYSASLLFDLNSELVAEFELLIDVLKKDCTDTKKFETLNRVYDQRFLSERMAYLYIGYTWDIESEANIKREYVKCRKAFKKGMEIISENEIDDEQFNADIEVINQRLKKNSKEIEFYKESVGMVYTDSKLINQKTKDISQFFESIY